MAIALRSCAFCGRSETVVSFVLDADGDDVCAPGEGCAVSVIPAMVAPVARAVADLPDAERLRRIAAAHERHNLHAWLTKTLHTGHDDEAPDA